MMMKRLALLAILALLALTSCERAPGSDQLSADIAQRLKQAFGDTMAIADVRRRGAAKDVAAPENSERRIVYFDLSLDVRRDLDLGSWDTPGAASLVSMLGAGPKGIYGVKSDGNKAGDVIRAHGSAIYRYDNGRWQIVTSAGFTPPPAPVTDNQAPPPVAETLLAALQTTIRSLPAGTSPRTNNVIEDELSRAVNNIRARLAHEQQGYAIAAGPEQGQYLRLVRALVQRAPDRRIRFTPLVTAGSTENLRLLRDGSVLLALTQGDIAALARAGEGPFADVGPQANLRALGSLYLEPLHIIVQADSPIRNVAQLKGRKINVGPIGSGTRVTALRVLAEHGIVPARGDELFDLTLTPALAALRDRRIDAVIEVIGVPANEIRTAFATLPLRFIPLDERIIAALTRANEAYVAAPIPAEAYEGVKEAVPSIGVAAILATTTELTAAEGFSATRFVYSVPDLVAGGSPQGAQVRARTAQTGLTIPLHEGAARALAELAPR
jgi:TRAP transporter TAXI family solute receptor